MPRSGLHTHSRRTRSRSRGDHHSKESRSRRTPRRDSPPLTAVPAFDPSALIDALQDLQTSVELQGVGLDALTRRFDAAG